MAVKQNIHPGEILQEDFLKPMNLTTNGLARAIGIQHAMIKQILGEKRSISADTAIRLSRFFGTTSEFWINLQCEHDLRISSSKKVQ